MAATKTAAKRTARKTAAKRSARKTAAKRPARKNAAKRSARKTAPKPQAAIRRFDIFAEYNRQEAMDKKDMKAAEAKGYGIWLAKVVASRRGRPKEDGADRGKRETPQRKPGEWRTLDDKPQTDKLFDKEIVGRMGREFYRKVFSPAISEARDRGASYEAIRDSLRRDWHPEPEG
jgi:hypothetical protein